MLNRLFTKKKKGEKRKKKNEENCSEFLDSLVGTIMHTIFQENNKGYDIKLFFFSLQRGHPYKLLLYRIKNTRGYF